MLTELFFALVSVLTLLRFDLSPEFVRNMVLACCLFCLSLVDLEIFENVAYIMAHQYDTNIPNNPEDWLDEFKTFSIYEILPSVLELWAMNEMQTAKPKKK